MIGPIGDSPDGSPGGWRGRRARRGFGRELPSSSHRRPARPLTTATGAHWAPGAFASTCVFVGLGPVGATLLRQLLAAGCTRYVLVDEGEFGRDAIGEECGPEEVGARRVDAIGVRLERRGASVVGKARSLEELASPPTGPCLVVVGTEEPSLVRAAHRFAHGHRSMR